MKPFTSAYVPQESKDRTLREALEDFRRRPDWYRATGVTSEDQVRAIVERAHSEGELFGNGDYTVTVYRQAQLSSKFPALDHLSIKRNDREPIHDWRELQAIKSALYSPEHEAVELYPAHSRVVDTANQYHLFVLVDLDDEGRPLRWPFGFQSRLVTDQNLGRARQRPGSGAEDGSKNNP